MSVSRLTAGSLPQQGDVRADLNAITGPRLARLSEAVGNHDCDGPSEEHSGITVSYTHLTLPTILRV